MGSTEGTGDKKATEKVVKAVPDGDLVYYNWAEYLDPQLMKDFEKRYGVKVRESNFDSMSAMMAKLRSGNRYDLIFPTADYVDRLRGANQLLRIDLAQLKNAGNAYDYFAKPWYDPAADHTIPYALYATGIIYRADKLNDLSGSWNDLANETAAGKTYLLDDYQEVMGAGNWPPAQSSTTTSPRGGREVQAMGPGPQAQAAWLLHRRHPEHGVRQRLDPPWLERRRDQRPQPGQEARDY